MTGQVNVIAGMLAQRGGPLTFSMVAGLFQEQIIGNTGFGDWVSGGNVVALFGSTTPSPLIWKGAKLKMMNTRYLFGVTPELDVMFLTENLPRDFFSSFTVSGPSVPLQTWTSISAAGFTSEPSTDVFGAGTRWRWDEFTIPGQPPPAFQIGQTYTLTLNP